MKNRKLTFLGLSALTLILVTILAFKPEYEDEEFILVRTIETNIPFQDSKIIVTDGQRITQTFDLEDTKSRISDENAIKIAGTLNQIKSQGYKLISSNSGLEGSGITNYIFEKK